MSCHKVKKYTKNSIKRVKNELSYETIAAAILFNLTVLIYTFEIIFFTFIISLLIIAVSVLAFIYKNIVHGEIVEFVNIRTEKLRDKPLTLIDLAEVKESQNSFREYLFKKSSSLYKNSFIYHHSKLIRISDLNSEMKKRNMQNKKIQKEKTSIKSTIVNLSVVINTSSSQGKMNLFFYW